MSLVEQEVIAPAEVTVRDVLHRAADLLETGEWEWCQGFARHGDALCMLGAVSAACGVVPERPYITIESELYEDACDVLAVHVPEGADWNDKPGRTKAEVVARLRQAAEAA